MMKNPLVNVFTGFKRRTKERIKHKQCEKSNTTKGNKSLTYIAFNSDLADLKQDDVAFNSDLTDLKQDL